ncbi:vacuolar protein sorting 41 [Aureobasidium namibiae CBS 147.97]|uniref:Vacuolar protein sorting 41 n=1 Tax=Aureobasidium namibiae CBS 147.97 TaxID=1043004 RepID=A0A074W7U8_9PEZI|nr:vacuolar protein sorting 41 [Aureobasidium namibiae CBS 147.97]KEQ69190.1 vacuolar protein sorting 41 [Aureobasidium namibiae CBS 147.97]
MSAAQKATHHNEQSPVATDRSSTPQPIAQQQPQPQHDTRDDDKASHVDSDSSGAEDDEEDDDEPHLKYDKLTGALGTVYRNGDATSSLLVAGDKMILGTHNGNIHTLALPSLHSLRLYHAHSASITAIDVSPTPQPFSNPPRLDRLNSNAWRAPPLPIPSSRNPKQPPNLPPTPSNLIHIATASIDGHVCVSSLVDPKDVTLRNFARPINAVALSPEYKTDRTYLSGGLSGNLIMTTGAKSGVSADANTNSAVAAASGWLGSIGLGHSTGKDTVLHSGEGAISTISFSSSGRFVVWVNEHGIKIMRSHLKLESHESESAWKRIAHIDRPNRNAWPDMASVWKTRVQWINDDALEADLDEPRAPNGSAAQDSTKPSKRSPPEKLLVGWGDTAWLIHVYASRLTTGKNGVQRLPGRADILHKLTFEDCVVSGLSLYTPSLLAVLAYRTRDDQDNPIPSSVQDTPKRGRHHRQTGLQPELRLINFATGEEVDVDTLNINRFESLSAADYQLTSLYVPPPPRLAPAQKGALENFGAGLWDAGASATRLFSSAGSVGGSQLGAPPHSTPDANPFLARTGLKLFVHSPYDCVLAIRRELSDHLSWLLERKQYGKAWTLIDDHPGIVGIPSDRQSIPSSPSGPTRAQNSLVDFFADEDVSQTTMSPEKIQNSIAIKEKQRVGDLWLQQLVANDEWSTAGKVAGQVLGTSSRWEKWVLAFAQDGHFDEITPYIPSTDMKPALPSFVYEVVLGHYIGHDRPRFRELLERWDPELFDITSVKTAIQNKLESSDVNEESVEGGERGRDWRILLDGLAKLHLAEGSTTDALRCYVRLQNGDAAMSLIREYHLADAVSDDIPGLLMLRVPREQMKAASLEELEEASAEVVGLLIDEAFSGNIRPEVVVSQLDQRGSTYQPFLFFYLRALWTGRTTDEETPMTRAERMKLQQQIEEGRLLVEHYGDLAVALFAQYDRELLMDFLRSSTSYTYEKASHICEEKHYVPELVYLLSKTGQTKRALFLIIEDLGDVSQAISFTKENPDLWDDLLDYSMDKPKFIRALLEEVGTSINPITVVRRIPNGLEVEGLREGIGKMIREYEIQHSISDGVAKVLRGEVTSGMDVLRAGQKKAVKFEVTHEKLDDLEVHADAVPIINGNGMEDDSTDHTPKPGYCVGCKDVFHQDEKETLIGFNCGHVFHLSCLLELDTKADQADARRGEGQRLSEDEEPVDTGRSVRTKVEHAHQIKRAVQGGCPVCTLPDESG